MTKNSMYWKKKGNLQKEKSTLAQHAGFISS